MNRCNSMISRNSLRLVAVIAACGAALVSASDISIEELGTWHAAKPPYEGPKFERQAFECLTLSIGSSKVDVYFTANSKLVVPKSRLLTWVKDAAISVSTFHGHFPVQHLNLIITETGPAGVHSGVTDSGSRIQIEVGRTTPESEFASDWSLTHEMFHLAFPDLDEEHLWMEEGMAVYLEPLARVRAGKLNSSHVWNDMIEGLPQGLPKRGDQGLDRTHTWARTYWGGALYWFLADIEIRKQTDGKYSIDDAMRAILKAGGDGSVHWDVERVLDVGDGATQTRVLHDLYAKMAPQAMQTDLKELWKSLGVAKKGKGVELNDAAPLAGIRERILKAEK